MREKNKKEINKNEEQSGKEELREGRESGNRRGRDGECKARKPKVSGGSIVELMFFPAPALLNHCRGSKLNHLPCTVLMHASLKATVGQE